MGLVANFIKLNISWDIIKKHDGVNWDWLLLSRNTMSKIKEEWIHNKRYKSLKPILLKDNGENQAMIQAIN